MNLHTKILIIPVAVILLVVVAVTIRQIDTILTIIFGGDAHRIVLNTGKPIPECDSDELHTIIINDLNRQRRDPRVKIDFTVSPSISAPVVNDPSLEKYCDIIYSYQSGNQPATISMRHRVRIFFSTGKQLGDNWLYRFGLEPAELVIE